MYESKETLEKQYGGTMTIDEVRAALISMPPNTKFSHPYFGNDEYIYRNEHGDICTEEGYPVLAEFWAMRRNGAMADNWYVKEKGE